MLLLAFSNKLRININKKFVHTNWYMKGVESGLCLLTATREVTGEEQTEKGFFRVCESILGVDAIRY
jgi:hypothetical protein